MLAIVKVGLRRLEGCPDADVASELHPWLDSMPSGALKAKSVGLRREGVGRVCPPRDPAAAEDVKDCSVDAWGPWSMKREFSRARGTLMLPHDAKGASPDSSRASINWPRFLTRVRPRSAESAAPNTLHKHHSMNISGCQEASKSLNIMFCSVKQDGASHKAQAKESTDLQWELPPGAPWAQGQ